jgi:hypothetical protein
LEKEKSKKKYSFFEKGLDFSAGPWYNALRHTGA